jgi:hypothetical protein
MNRFVTLEKTLTETQKIVAQQRERLHEILMFNKEVVETTMCQEVAIPKVDGVNQGQRIEN